MTIRRIENKTKARRKNRRTAVESKQRVNDRGKLKRE